MTDFEQKVLAELSALRVQMDQVLGIGQPGRLNRLEKRVDCHERSLQRFRGLLGACGAALALLQMVAAYMGGRN